MNATPEPTGETGSPRATNRLAQETSPYLLQHAHNPVDWYPWGDEAFARAAEEDKPVFLSVGYSTCHWCHVMERESFERDDVAEILNEHYISIKVDREERPDIDEIYMNATQLMTRHGGWPNSVWLTPDRKPWYAGTYFPPEDRGNRPGFKSVLTSLAETWRTRRTDVEAQAKQLVDSIESLGTRSTQRSSRPLGRDLVEAALRELRLSFDAERGGFGEAPKFPPHGALRLLWREYRNSHEPAHLDLASGTLDAMANGGIHDHVGGGFHRYSTDADWLLPHFEKMLYDNAQLGRAYVDGFLITEDERYKNIADGIFNWVMREMTDEAGGFHSALDADSEGEEGKFYVWSREEILEILGDEEGEIFCRTYEIRPDGNFTDEATGHRPGTNIPHQVKNRATIAAEVGVSPAALASRLAAARDRLREVRAKRVWPHLDDKVLTSWNGLMIGSLAYAGRVLQEPRYVKAAEGAARFILSTLVRDGRTLRTYRGGEAKLTGYLDDAAFLAEGLLELHAATDEDVYLDAARAQLDQLLEHYRDAEGQPFYFTRNDHEDLLVRSQDPYDRALPSGNGVAALTLIELYRRTGEARYRDAARDILESFQDAMERAPRGTEALILACAEYLDLVKGAPPEEASSEVEEWADLEREEGPIRLRVFASQLEVTPGGRIEVAVQATIASGWHIGEDAPEPHPEVEGSRLLAESVIASSIEITSPSAQVLADESGAIPVYIGKSTWRIVMTVSEKAPAGVEELHLHLRARPCGPDRCLDTVDLLVGLPIAVRPTLAERPPRFPQIFRSP